MKEQRIAGVVLEAFGARVQSRLHASNVPIVFVVAPIFRSRLNEQLLLSVTKSARPREKGFALVH
jgi:hypothetical protein